MPKLERRVFSLAIAVAVVAFLAVSSMLVPARGLGGGYQSSPVKTLDSDQSGQKLTSSEAVPAAPNIMLASASSGVALVLPRLAFSTAQRPPSPTSDAVFSSAENLRSTGDAPDAIRAYLQVITDHPGTPLATAAATQVLRVTEVLTPDGLIATESAIPPSTDLIAGDDAANAEFWFLQRSRQLIRIDAGPLKSILPALCDRAWRMLQQRPEDPQIQTALDVALMASDAAGNGDATRAKLSTYADSIRPCYLAWAIKTSVDGTDPSFDFVPTYEGKVLVAKYYASAGGHAKDPDQKRAWYTKARDAELELLTSHAPEKPVFDHCINFLMAAEALGEKDRRTAIDEIESFLKNQPLTITRWLARYELADFLTHSGNSAEDTHAGFLHFEELVKESNAANLDQAVNDSTVDGRTRGLIFCVLGHGYAGTNRVDDAETCYQWVMDNFPYEVHPEETAAYSLAVAENRKYFDTPAVGAAAYEQFADNHPVGGYTPDALLTAAENYARANDTDSAAKVYQRVAHEFAAKASIKKMAEDGLVKLDDAKRRAN